MSTFNSRKQQKSMQEASGLGHEKTHDADEFLEAMMKFGLKVACVACVCLIR